MSRSINEILKFASRQSEAPEENELNNTELPDIERLAKELDDKEELFDQYHLVMTNSSKVRSGMAFLNVEQPFKRDPQNEMLRWTNSIDPNILKSMSDPDNALPSLSSQSLFSLIPENVEAPHSKEDLLRSSHASEINYKNRSIDTDLIDHDPSKIPPNYRGHHEDDHPQKLLPDKDRDIF